MSDPTAPQVPFGVPVSFQHVLSMGCSRTMGTGCPSCSGKVISWQSKAVFIRVEVEGLAQCSVLAEQVQGSGFEPQHWGWGDREAWLFYTFSNSLICCYVGFHQKHCELCLQPWVEMFHMARKITMLLSSRRFTGKTIRTNHCPHP